MRILRRLPGILTVAAALTAAAAGQYPVVYQPAEEGTEIRVEGTSTLHDWHATGTAIEGRVRLLAAENDDGAVLKAIRRAGDDGSLSIEAAIPVRSIASEKDGLNKKMYKALKHEQHPRITYRLTSARPASEQPSEAGRFALHTTGKLTVAGKTRQIEMRIVAAAGEDRFTAEGEKQLKMSWFDIEPPSALFGMVEAADPVTVQFRWVTERASPAPERVTAALPEPQAGALREAWASYLEAGSALRGGKLAEARSALGEAIRRVPEVPAEGLSDEAAQAWGRHAETVEAAAEQADGAEDLSAVRQAYAGLSEALAGFAGRWAWAETGCLVVYEPSGQQAGDATGPWLQPGRDPVDSPYGSGAGAAEAPPRVDAIYCHRPEG